MPLGTEFFSTRLTALLASAGVALVAQTTGRPDESLLTQELHQALSLAEHGDRQRAMALALQMLQQNPKFVPATKLKGMLLEDSPGSCLRLPGRSA